MVDITSKDLSDALGMKQQKRVSDIEEGRGLPTLEEINAAAVYFKVSIDDILKRRAHLKVEFTDTL